MSVVIYQHPFDARRRLADLGVALEAVITALEAGQGFHLEVVCRGYFGQRPTGFELVQHLGCLGVQTRRDFLLAPARLDLVLDLVERTFARR